MQISIPTNIWVGDFETTPYSQFLKEGRTRVWLFYVSNMVDNKINKMGLSVEEFIDWIWEKTDEASTIYFHNLSFDGEFLLWYFIEFLEYIDFSLMKPADANKKKKEADNYFNFFKDETGIIYILEAKINGKLLTFKCSYKLLTMSVDNLPEVSNTRKYEFGYDYDKEHYETSLEQVAQHEKDYIINDVEKVRVALLHMSERFENLPMTAASLAYRRWSNPLEDEPDEYYIDDNGNQKKKKKKTNHYVNWYNTLTKSNKYQKWYNGGLTYLDPDKRDKVFKDKIYVSDVNSLYPDRMYREAMPFPLKKPCEDNSKCNHMKLYQVVIDDLRIKDDYIPFLQKSGFTILTKQAEKYIEGKSVFFLTDIELEQVKKYYTWKSIWWNVEECFAKRRNVFTEYIDYWYEIKRNSSGYEKFSSKIMLNSLYGKYGTKPNKPSKVFSLEQPENIKSFQYGKYYEYTRILTPEEFIFYKGTKEARESGSIDGKVKLYWNPIAIYITAYARVYLVEAIQLNREGFVYCDTDSIHSTNQIMYVKHDNNELGAWKQEGVNNFDGVYYYGGKYLNKKQYVLFKKPYEEIVEIEEHMKACVNEDCQKCKDEKNPEKMRMLIKVCGMSKNKQSMVELYNFNYDHEYQNAKNNHKRVKGGVVIIPSGFTIKDLTEHIDKVKKMI